MAKSVIFDMAAAAILNFAKIWILLVKPVRGPHFLSVCEILRKSVEKWPSYGRLTKFKMAAAAIWIYFRRPFLSSFPLWVVAGDVCAKFHNCSSIYGWVIKICPKIQDGGCRHLELIFCYPGPPTKPFPWSEGCVKISWQSLQYFPRYGHLKILQIWLKMPIPAPKIYVFGGFWPLNIIFHHRDPQKALPCAKTRRLTYRW